MKKFASIGVVRETLKSESRESSLTSNQADARYALTITGSEQDSCLFGDEVLLKTSIELTDLRANEVVAVFEKTDWTGRCGFKSGPYLFEIIAEAIDKAWSEPNLRTPAGRDND